MRDNGSGSGSALQVAVGIAAIVAPALHCLSDLLEWSRQGFGDGQLWLTYLAFLPMPWLLLGIYAVHRPRPGAAALAGAILYGIAFTYFAHTALYALAERIPTYEALWQRLGATYTVHGALMVVGGLLFAWSVLRSAQLPRVSVWLFAAGLGVNLVLALLPAPDILQVFGTAIRSAGLMLMGYAIVSGGMRGGT